MFRNRRNQPVRKKDGSRIDAKEPLRKDDDGSRGLVVVFFAVLGRCCSHVNSYSWFTTQFSPFELLENDFFVLTAEYVSHSICLLRLAEY